MSPQNPESSSAEESLPTLDLNKETLADLDVDAADAQQVRGGFIMKDTIIIRTGGVIAQPAAPINQP